jgi:SET domain-containing protein
MDINKYFHNSPYNLYLTNSQIPDSGLGVFTKDFIPAGSCIDEYSGDVYFFNPGGFYVLEVNEKYYIDANNYPRCFMAMINDCGFIAKKKIRKKKRKIDITPDAYYDKNNNKLVINCEFIIKPEEKKTFVYSLIDINKDSELFISYGTNYWN